MEEKNSAPLARAKLALSRNYSSKMMKGRGWSRTTIAEERNRTASDAAAPTNQGALPDNLSVTRTGLSVTRTRQRLRLCLPDATPGNFQTMQSGNLLNIALSLAVGRQI